MSESAGPPMTLANLQVLVGALIGGVVALTLVAAVVSPPGASSFELGDRQTIWLGLLIAVVVGAAVMLLVLGRVLVGRSSANAAGESWTAEESVTDFATYTVVRCALTEGVGLLGATVYLVTGLGAGLVVVLLSVVTLAVFFPTMGRLEAFREIVTRPE